MPDNWSFVIAAYSLAAVVLAAYWRFLFRLEKLLAAASAARQGSRRPATRRPSP